MLFRVVDNVRLLINGYRRAILGQSTLSDYGRMYLLQCRLNIGCIIIFSQTAFFLKLY